MKKLILTSVLAALCLIRSARGQAINAGLQIGDQVPDLLITNILNHSFKSLKLSEYRGKLLLLDFWASWCSGCIENLPRIEFLAGKYKDRFAVLGVDDEPKSKVEMFFRRKSHDGKPYHFTTTYEDKVLRKWFPHSTIPHCIWIDPSGKIIAITGAAEVTEQSVLAALANHSLTHITKRDIDPQQPLFLNQWFNPDSLQNYFIFIRGSYPGTGSSSLLRVRGKDTIGQGFTNTSLLGMYEVLGRRQLMKWGRYFGQQVAVETPDSAKLRYELHQVKYIQSNPSPYAHNADFIVPSTKRDSLFQLMIMELNRYTGYQAVFEQRKVSILALQRISNQQEIKTKGGSPVYLSFQDSTGVAINQPMKAIIAKLNTLPGISHLIMDETGIQSPVDLRFSGSTTLSAISQDLENQGLRLVNKEVMLTVLVIKGQATP